MIPAHFISFASRRYWGALARIRHEAAGMERFASIAMRDDRWLGPDYWRVHAHTARRHRQGFGLYTWKPYVIRRSLEALREGEMLVYCDAGCSLNREGRRRLEDYLHLAHAHPSQALGFTLSATVGQSTKRATLAAFDAEDEAMRRRPMVLAGILVLVAGPATLELAREWERRMADVSLVDDSPSPHREFPEFRAHRHDQSIFTLLAHERRLQTIPDETWWSPAWERHREFPIHARRWRHRLPWSQGWMRRGLWPRW